MVTRTKKVFVGGLSAPTTLEDVKNYFQQFGRRDKDPLLSRMCFRSLESADQDLLPDEMYLMDVIKKKKL
ncbi:hypothetical protein CEXT_283491 [Caerostris extrusa]|uniref:Uncharacterized protein n=1 Tax=Caerostris extrusa TaxID=172846 RepID=A0AAV4WS44_CAEEX|nr:hypothetical protein CEXT_283491 [Caerostris extrusa]